MKKVYVLMFLTILLFSQGVYADNPNNNNNSTVNNNTNSSTSNTTNNNSATGGTGVGVASSNSDSNSNSDSSSNSSGGSANNSIKMKGSYSHGFSAAQGQSSLQIGSLLFGSIAVSEDDRHTVLKDNILVIANLADRGFVTKDVAKSYIAKNYKELDKLSKKRKCLGFLPCGRLLSNLLS